jgi:hypothetical protein
MFTGYEFIQTKFTPKVDRYIFLGCDIRGNEEFILLVYKALKSSEN